MHFRLKLRARHEEIDGPEIKKGGGREGEREREREEWGDKEAKLKKEKEIYMK